jgi:cellobiose phosphorylase
VKPDYGGLRLDPCIPSQWKEFTMEREFRGKWLKIRVDNSKGVQKGVVKIVHNGEEIEGNFIPMAKIKEQNEVTVVMG